MLDFTLFELYVSELLKIKTNSGFKQATKVILYSSLCPQPWSQNSVLPYKGRKERLDSCPSSRNNNKKLNQEENKQQQQKTEFLFKKCMFAFSVQNQVGLSWARAEVLVRLPNREGREDTRRERQNQSEIPGVRTLPQVGSPGPLQEAIGSE